MIASRLTAFVEDRPRQMTATRTFPTAHDANATTAVIASATANGIGTANEISFRQDRRAGAAEVGRMRLGNLQFHEGTGGRARRRKEAARRVFRSHIARGGTSGVGRMMRTICEIGRGSWMTRVSMEGTAGGVDDRVLSARGTGCGTEIGIGGQAGMTDLRQFEAETGDEL